MVNVSEEVKEKEKQSKVPLEKQYEQAGIKNIDPKEIRRMVNSTKGDPDFKVAFPDVKFSRTLAYKYMQQKYDMDYIGSGYLIPHGVTIEDLLDTYDTHKNITSDAESTQSVIKNNIIEIDGNDKKGRQTLSMNAGTLKRWKELTSGINDKGLFLTAALEYFMDQYTEKKFKIISSITSPDDN